MPIFISLATVLEAIDGQNFAAGVMQMLSPILLTALEFDESRGASKCTWSSSCPGPLSAEYE